MKKTTLVPLLEKIIEEAPECSEIDLAKKIDSLASRIILDYKDCLLTSEEVAKILKFNRRHIRNLASKGELPGFKLGNEWNFSKEKLWESFYDRIELNS